MPDLGRCWWALKVKILDMNCALASFFHSLATAWDTSAQRCFDKRTQAKRTDGQSGPEAVRFNDIEAPKMGKVKS